MSGAREVGDGACDLRNGQFLARSYFFLCVDQLADVAGDRQPRVLLRGLHEQRHACEALCLMPRVAARGLGSRRREETF